MIPIIEGHVYKLSNMDNPEITQRIEFIRMDETGERFDGTTNEEVLLMLIDRLNVLNAKIPSRDNQRTIEHLEEALLWQYYRTKDRVQRGVEGTHNP